MGVLDEQIDKARRRACGIDLAALSAAAADLPPKDLASPQALAERRRVLTQTFGDTEESQVGFERLIAGNELQPINYLAHGQVAARPVCRLTLNSEAGQLSGYATGFLIAPGVLLTNHHVFPTAASATRSIAEFDFELDVFDQPKQPIAFELAPDRLFLTSDTLDYSLVAVAETGAGGTALAGYGYLPLFDDPGKAVEGEWLTIVQHPNGERKQLCVRENKLLTRTADVLWYSTDTLGGSSGAPVFNNDWQVVALHHKGVPETRNGVIQTVDGRDYDPARDAESAIKWIANEGIRISRLIEAWRAAAPDAPLLAPVFGMTAETARRLTDQFAGDATASPSAATLKPAASAPTRTAAMPSRSITLTLDLSDDGSVRVRQGGDMAPAAAAEAAPANAASVSAPVSTTPAVRPAEYEVAFDTDYSAGGARQGYDPAFLGAGFEVPDPVLGALAADATPVRDAPADAPYRLNYRNYSVVMHRTRKFAIYSAANVDGANRFSLRRPHDNWRLDPRIPQDAQIGDYYYAKNQFDRGHLTRYEDLEFGASPDAALQSAADTLHFTNCTPQHARFNQSKALWQGLEQEVLEQSIRANAFRAQVLTGPVLDPGDPVWDKYPDVQYPLKFWKIAVARTSADALFAAGFVLDQSDVIAQFGIEATVEVPFGAFKTYQVPIAEIERLTGLTFTMRDGESLSGADPLRVGSAARRAAAAQDRVQLTESTAAGAVPYGYVLLSAPGDMIRG